MTTTNKERKIHRATAKKLLDRLVADVNTYNEDRSNPFYVKAIYVFGSYVNTDKELLSDLDIALEWGAEHDVWTDWYNNHLEEVRKYLRIKGNPELIDSLMYARRKALIGFRHKSPNLQLTDYYVDEDIVKSSKYIRIGTQR